MKVIFKTNYSILEDTALYEALLPDPAEGFGQGFFCPSEKRELIMLFWLILGPVLGPVVTLVNFSCPLSKNPKKNPLQKSKKKLKIQNVPKNEKIKKFKKNPQIKPKKSTKNPKKSIKKTINPFFQL